MVMTKRNRIDRERSIELRKKFGQPDENGFTKAQADVIRRNEARNNLRMKAELKRSRRSIRQQTRIRLSRLRDPNQDIVLPEENRTLATLI